mgnify:CR=1 FL=1
MTDLQTAATLVGMETGWSAGGSQRAVAALIEWGATPGRAVDMCRRAAVSGVTDPDVLCEWVAAHIAETAPAGG